MFKKKYKYEYKKYFQFLTKFRISSFIKDKKYLLLATFINFINKLNILCRSDKYKAFICNKTSL